ncbi:hypothetical protein H5410_028284 [Solanum commersonii]|uniref:Oligopeptide transporter OPT superfamily n=1 Tax=Solanum commersonii TaxID=4109 RepID=A0A9J5Z4D0_SOLCO|nr:hypothetical protein H5410_028284 [Solanum commersonii]
MVTNTGEDVDPELGVAAAGESSTENAFKDEYVTLWHKQITFRAMFTGFILSVVFNFIVCKLNLTTGVIPSLNVAAGLLGFAGIKSWTSLTQKFGMLKQPFTRQENTVIQTCVVASSGITFSSGTASYMLGMSPYIASQADAGNLPINTKNLAITWMLPYLLVVSFASLFSIVALRKMMIMKYKLMYPSGTATAYLINCFHTPKGAELAKKQVGSLFKSFGFSFIFGAVQWIFARDEGCGFASLHTFGSQAYAKRLYFDFSSTYVGVAKKGDWYSAHLSATSLHGIQGYRVFIAIAMMLGDGLFHFAYMLVVTILSFTKRTTSPQNDCSEEDDDEKIRNDYFLKDQIPNWADAGGCAGIAVVSIIVVPMIFHSLKWYHVMLLGWFGEWWSDCWTSLMWFNDEHTRPASGLMGDFKTGYLTLTSSRSMFFSQLIGTAMGCVITPLVFWIFNSAYRLGDPEGSYPAPYALMYRGIALLGVEGFGSLPKHCLNLSICFFLAAILINLVTQLLKKFETKYRIYRFIPSPMCMAIPFYLGGYFAIDMCLGSLILFGWQMYNKQKAKDFGPAMASGLICGDSLWGIPASILALAGVKAPFCLKV